MKKLFLLFALGITGASVNAQENNSVVFTQNKKINVPEYNNSKHVILDRQNKSVNRTTATGSYWFSFENENYSSTVSTSGVWPIYNDSSLYVSTADGASTPFNWYMMGLGTSFDPTSTDFYPANIANPDVPIPTFLVGSTNAYAVDSIEIVGQYQRMSYNGSVVDTLNIYVAAADASATGTYNYINDNAYFANLTIPDSTMHMYTPAYDVASNSILSSQVPGVVKYQIFLTPTVYADTDANGLIDTLLALPLSVPAGGKIVAYEQFISGQAYHFNYDLDSANIWNVLVYDLYGSSSWPHQNNNDYNAGLLMAAEARYNVDTQAFIIGSTNYISSTYWYASENSSGGLVPATYQDPYFAFHITCASCNNLAVPQVKNNISGVDAYPNPATGELNVSFTLSQSAAASVTLTNMLGEVVATKNVAGANSSVATFNTAALPAGVYIYTVLANGERFTGHVAIAH